MLVNKLASLKLFQSLPVHILETISDSGELVDVKKGVLMNISKRNPSLAILVEGRALIISSTSTIYNQYCVYDLANKGETLGDFNATGSHTFEFSIKPLTRSQILIIPNETLVDLLKSFEFSNLLLVMSNMRLQRAYERLSDNTFLDAIGRLAKSLIDLSEGEDTFMIPLTQQELSGLVGISRERTNKAIRQLIQGQFISKSERRYQILDRKKLKALTRL